MSAAGRCGMFFFIVMANVCLTSPLWPLTQVRSSRWSHDKGLRPPSILESPQWACRQRAIAGPFPPVSTFAHLARHPCSAAIKPMSSSSSWSACGEIREENVLPAFCYKLIPRRLCVHHSPACTHCSLYFPHLISTFISKTCHFKVIFHLTFIVRCVYSTCACRK